MQQQSGAVEFVQKTGGRTLKEHLKKKKDRKTGGKNGVCREKLATVKRIIQKNVIHNIL